MLISTSITTVESDLRVS